jgi:hypothetical protein
MDFSVEKYISNFVQNQFPQFYLEDGPDFILFVKAYYEWMESENQSIYQSRRLFDYRDIDNTVESFLEFFQKKYLYGIPFDIISNKRFILKHILDVYRSKGSINCYKLLFKLIYNEDIDVYLPSVDVLRVSDGTWKEPKFLEVTAFDNILDYNGKTIIGTNSKVTATVENVVKQTFNGNFVTLVYISGISPTGSTFLMGENIVPLDKINDYDYISNSPNILGSIETLQPITNGGRDYKIDDILKIVERDPETSELLSYGRDGLLKVTGLKRGNGELFFDIIDGGFGFTPDSEIFIYRNDNTGFGASFELGNFTNQQDVTYNTDIVGNFLEKSLDAVSFSFDKLPSANLSSTLEDSLNYTNNIFGTINSLTNINPGLAYTKPANVFVRSVTLSQPIQANVFYSSNSTNVSFSTSEQILTYKDTLLNAPTYGFPRNPSGNVSSTLESTISLSSLFNFFKEGDIIHLQANSSDSNTSELHVIKTINGVTSLSLYTTPKNISTDLAEARVAAVILPSNFLLSEEIMNSPNLLTNGLNERIRAFPSVGDNVITSVKAISGKGFSEGENVTASLYGSINTIVDIINPGIGYSNSDILVFETNDYSRLAEAFIITNDNGSIIDVVVTNRGSGYSESPEIYISTKTGSGAILKTSVVELNFDFPINGRVKKTGIGKEIGFYSTTRGHLNSDKYIQDSFYYQDFSYEILVPLKLNKYKSILYETFHSAGSELFGRYLSTDFVESGSSILFEEPSAIITQD